MFEYNFNAMQGLLDLVNLLTFMATVDKEGLIHKFNALSTEKINEIIKVAKQITPSNITPDDNLYTLVTPSNISNISSIINNLDLSVLQSLSSVFTQENIQILNSMLPCLKCMGLFDKNISVSIPNDININLVLINITSINFPELLNINNVLAFLGNLSIPVLQIEEFLKNQFTLDLQNIDLSGLALNMPNFASYTSILNLSFLTNLFNPNEFCTTYLSDFFSQYNSLKIDFMDYINTNIVNFDLSFLENSLYQYNAMIDNLSVQLDTYTDMLVNLDPLISQFEANLNTYLTGLSLSPDCANTITSKIEGLKSFKTVLINEYIKPLTNQIEGLKIRVDSVTSSINSIKTLQFDLPSFDC